MISGGILQTGNMMNKGSLLIIILSGFLFFMQPVTLLSSQIILKSEDQFKFALEYMKKGKFQQAVGEFERFIYFFPGDEKVPGARYLIGVCYLDGKEYEQARKVFREIGKSYPAKAISREAFFLIGESYYREGALEEAERYFRKVMDDYPDTELANAAKYRLGWSQMKKNKWRDASESFKTVKKKSPLYLNSQELSVKSLEGEDLSYRSPTAAGMMAAIVPGMGHVYCNRPKDGLVALLLNGLFAWAAYESFEQEQYVLGGVLCFIEFGWYTGNIYSAVNSAHKYNRKARDDYRKKLPDKFKVGLFTTRKGHIGLAMKITF